MKLGLFLLRLYSFAISIFVILGAVSSSISSNNYLFLLFLPLIGHFFFITSKIKRGSTILLYYDFILVTVMAMMGFVSATSISQLISAILFSPIAFYFWILAIPTKKKLIPTEMIPTEFEVITPPVTHQKKATHADQEKAEKPESGEAMAEEKPIGDFDMDRRKFLKLIGAAGLTLFVFSIFTKRAQDSFFGKTAAPGAVALKDSANKAVDPALEHPTDGYKITEVDDSTPTYFGFVDKNGRWFIMKEGETGAFRYSRGDLDFSTNWSNRASLNYGYFDAVF